MNNSMSKTMVRKNKTSDMKSRGRSTSTPSDSSSAQNPKPPSWSGTILGLSILLSLAVIGNLVPHSNVLVEFIYRISQALTCRKSLPSWSPWGLRFGVYLLMAFLGHTLNRLALGIQPSWIISVDKPIPFIWAIVLLAYIAVHLHKSVYDQLSNLHSAVKVIEMGYKFRANANLIWLCILRGYQDHWVFIGRCCSIDICTSRVLLSLLTREDLSWSERCKSLMQDLAQSMMPGFICVLTYVTLPHYYPDLEVLGLGLALVYFGYRYCPTHYRGIVTQLRSSSTTKKNL